jgi:AcrR family transcriptional regulator
MNSARGYSMAVRSLRAAATRDRILEVTQELFVDPSSDLTLEQIAARSSVSVQTVLRAFGSKERLLLAAIGTMRETEEREVKDPPASIAEAVERVFEDYERIGDRVIRMLAEEHRIPGLSEVAGEGRARHRAWVEAAFAAPLSAHRGRRRKEVVTALVAATDVYLWQLLRRDLQLDRKAAEAVVNRLVKGALANDKEG